MSEAAYLSKSTYIAPGPIVHRGDRREHGGSILSGILSGASWRVSDSDCEGITKLCTARV